MRLALYYAAGANCCERVRWTLDYKGIPYELVDIEKPHDEAHFAQISPFGRVPILEINGEPLSESMAMVELLEDFGPDLPLNYVDPMMKSRVREVCEAINASIHPIQNGGVVRRFHPEWSAVEQKAFRVAWLEESFARLEPLLWLSGPFAVGDRFTFADIFVACLYHKGRSMGMTPLEGYEAHLSHLQSLPDVASSSPLPPL